MPYIYLTALEHWCVCNFSGEMHVALCVFSPIKRKHAAITKRPQSPKFPSTFRMNGSNCIDLVLVSTPDLIWDISVVEPFSSSCDHSAIHFSVSYPVVISDRQNHCFLDFFNADYFSMISIMKDIDWSFLCQNSLSVEMFWSKISNVLHSCITQFVPCRYQSCKPRFLIPCT